jgi:hypothetical protein
MLRFIFLLPLLFLPHTLLASVTINEVAWMGSIESANDEWIELYNDGSSVSLDGWMLSDGQNLEITLAGAVGAGQYAVLERTDDSSAPGSAFLIYTGALGNDGRTLTLRRANGAVEDQVVGGENWQNIGGDNFTKETAQYTRGGWVTGKATPGKKNVASGSVKEVEDEQEVKTSNDTSKEDGKNIYISLVEPNNELSLSIEAPKTGYVNQPVKLEVTPSGLGERIMDSLVYTWNFGNLATSSGREVPAVYTHPGTYVIVVEADYTKYIARARHTITILPTTVSITKNKDGDILIQNNAQYEVDVSGFTLKGNKAVTFPEYTFLAPKATMVVPTKKVTDYHSTMVMLYDRGKDMVASSLGFYLEAPSLAENVAAVQTEIIPIVRASSNAKEPEETVEVGDEPIGIISATNTSKEKAARPGETKVSPGPASVTAAGIPGDKLPYLGLLGLISIGIIALYSTGQK